MLPSVSCDSRRLTADRHGQASRVAAVMLLSQLIGGRPKFAAKSRNKSLKAIYQF
jgi:hypothetical protein